MKNQIKKTIIGGLLGIAGLLCITQIGVFAEGDDPNVQGLVGSWDVTVTPRNCETGSPAPFPPPFLAVQTYNLGGTMTASNLGAPGIMSLDGHGVWSHGKGRRYLTAFRVLKFNADGTYAGKDVIRDSINLGIDAGSYTSTGTVEIFDASGNLLLTGCATTSATRFE